MGKIFAIIFLKLSGWKIPKAIPGNPDKVVLIMAPHTSNWDFIIGRVAMLYYRKKAKFLIKSEAFKGPFGWVTKVMGGVPVERGQKNDIVNQAIDYIKKNDDIAFIFTPEGTRKRTNEFKSGFYHVATKANVPMLISTLNYKEKRANFIDYKMTGNVDIDVPNIRKLFIGIPGKNPENGIFE